MRWHQGNLGADGVTGPPESAAQFEHDPAPFAEPGRARPVVLTGVDGSRSGQVALAVAARQAATLGAELVGVHVPPAVPWLWSLSPGLIAQFPGWLADMEASAFLDTAAAAGRAGLSWCFTVERGEVAAALQRQARRRAALLVVMAAGTRHRWPRRCPARRLAAICDRPVLIAAPRRLDLSGTPL